MKSLIKHKYIFSALFCLNISILFGQTKAIQNSTLKSKSENKKVADSLYNVASKYDDTGDYKKAIELFYNSLNKYQNIGEGQKIGDCYTRIGFIHYQQGDYSKALSFYKNSAGVYKSVGYKKGVSGILNNIAGVYYGFGNYPQAVEYFRQAAVIQEEIGDKQLTATITQNIGTIYAKIKDYTNAIKYFDKANSIFKEIKDEKGVAKIFIETGYIYMKQGNFEKALKDFNRAFITADEEEDKYLKIQVLSNLGELFNAQLDIQKASDYYNLCLKLAKETNNLQYMSTSQIAIGNIFHQSKRYKEAVEKCKSGLNIAEKMRAVPVKKTACECLYNSYKSLGENKLALKYHEKISIYEDSLQSEETSNRMMNMEFQKQQFADSIANVKKEHLVQLKHKEEVQKKEKQRNIIIISLGFILLIAGGLWSRLNLVRKSKASLQIEKDRSEALLLNILPEEIAEELKEKGSVNAKEFNLVSIIFTDFKSFTQTAEKMSPQSLVEEINVCFKAFDLITEKYHIEKIKTIGDAYMAAGGMSNDDKSSLVNTVLAGIEMQEFVVKRTVENQKAQAPFFEMRLGIHAGPIVAGIVGVKKFQYDIWGDTVNTASRIESNGMVGKVNISESLYQLLKDEDCFTFEYRGAISAKGKGDIKMYFVEKN